MKKKINWKNIRREQILLLIIIVLVFPGILIAAGTITSGWHLVDDHETLRIARAKIEENILFFDALKKEWAYDFTHRWRPAYWFFRVLGAYLFGADSIMHNLFLCLLGAITYFFLYQSARNLKSGVFYAHCFAVLVCVGRQYEIWYRVANQENIGLFFLSICLWIISKQYKENSYDQGNFILLVCVVLCSLMKESFFLVLPGVVLLRIGLEGIQMCEKGIKKWMHLLITRFWFWAIALVAFLWSAYMILFRVGTAPIDYAGVDMEAGWKQVVWNIIRMRQESLSNYVWITASFGVILFIVVLNRIFHKRYISLNALLLSAFAVYVLTVEIILYAKSGMWDRYLVPFVVGYNLLFVILAERALQNRLIKGLYSTMLIIFIGLNVYFAFVQEAIPYGEEGRQLQATLEFVEGETGEDDDILVSLGAREMEVAMCKYLEYRGRPNVFIYVKESTGNEWQMEYNSTMQRGESAVWKLMIASPESANAMLENNVEEDEQWKENVFGDYFLVWVRKK